MIGDEHGSPVWFRPVGPDYFATNLRVQEYRGEPVLTWWEGTPFGLGEGVIVDSSYREIARIRAHKGQVDPHELVLTREGTALFFCYSPVPADLSSVGGSKDGQVLDPAIQEIDVQTGRLLMEWRGIDHIAVSESYVRPGGIYDFMHANSISVTPDGNLLVSVRHTWALYKLERSTGQVIWRLGGKRSDFSMGPGTRFAWQHDASQPDRKTITVFDNGAAVFAGTQVIVTTHSQSRALVLEVDEAHKTVRLGRSYHHHPPRLTYGYGSVQSLHGGEMAIGWGNLPLFTRLGPHGSVLEEGRMPHDYSSYRAYHQRWKGVPAHPPALVARRDARRQRSKLYASWNGATGVSAWQVNVGRRPGNLQPLRRVKQQGFETSIEIGVTTGYANVTALDHRGQALGHSHAVKL